MINLKQIQPELFSDIAKQSAINIAGDNKHSRTNKATQLRKFYDEIVMWDNKVAMHPEKFSEYLPFIRMLNAKAAYAEGRKLVDHKYVTLLNGCLQQVENEQTMRTFKLFMEAFMGFYKQERPS